MRKLNSAYALDYKHLDKMYFLIFSGCHKYNIKREWLNIADPYVASMSFQPVLCVLADSRIHHGMYTFYF